MANFGSVYNASFNTSKIAEKLIRLDSDISVSLTGQGDIGSADDSIADIESVFMFIDDDDNKEFAVLMSSGSSRNLDIYTVDTDVPSIALSGSFPVTLSSTYGISDFLGIKKSSSSIYKIFYLGGSPRDDGEVELWEVEIEVGVGSTTTKLQTMDFSTDGSFAWEADYRLRIANKVAHIAVLKGYASMSNPYGYDVYIYTFNMTSETFAGGLVWQSGGTPAHPKSFNNNTVGSFAYAETNGVLNWFTAYADRFGGTDAGYLVKNGSTSSLIYSVVSTPRTFSSSFIGSWQYNYGKYLLEVTFNRSFSVPRFYTATMDSDDTFSVSGSASTPTFRFEEATTFMSESNFPNMAASGTHLYKADYTDGSIISEINIADVDTIYQIFPSLDNNDGSIYMYALLDDASEKLIGVDYASETINTTYDNAVIYKNLSGYWGFNHGNFFMQWNKTLLKVSYLLGVSADNKVMMIIEQN